MKISNLETAKKLALITGRPLEEFYSGQIETIDDQQEEEETVAATEESYESTTSESSATHLPEIRISETGIIRRIPVSNEECLYSVKYGGKYSDNGVLICHTRDMSRSEYKEITKGMTQSEVLKHPLLHVLFRAEEQKEGHFYAWLENFPKE